MKINVIKPTVDLITPSSHILDAEKLIEKAGRTCYKSEDKITPLSANAFVERIVQSGHLSVIEHINVTMKFVGDRSMSHQLVRHRLAAYSQESQRYCNYLDKGWSVICPPKVADIKPATYIHNYDNYGNWGTDDPDIKILTDRNAIAFLDAMADAFRSYESFKIHGAPSEDARCVLPNAVKTEVVATYNLRTWRHLFDHRALNPRAQWQIRGLMQESLRILSKYVPAAFADQLETLNRQEKE